MAGYIFSIGAKSAREKLEIIKNCISNGVYSTALSTDMNAWGPHHEGTFTDYLSMKEGDKIFFFAQRKIYGIGELVNIKGDCKAWNYIDAANIDNHEMNTPLIDSYTEKNRCVCFFKPSPLFYKKPVDMDDALLSNPSAFKMLRAFWKLSFIKIDDEECDALIDIILRRNINTLDEGYQSREDCFENVEKLINNDYFMSAKNWLKEKSSRNGIMNHEMSIEADLVEKISNRTIDIFGKWDYISHQVIASPFKPVDYMYKMDIFAYHYSKIDQYEIKDKFMIIEIKKGVARPEVLNQIMHYVDWVTKEYAYGDLSLINAFIVAYDFSAELLNQIKKICVRNYSYGYNPSVASVWNNIKLVKYHYSENGNIDYELVYNGE